MAALPQGPPSLHLLGGRDDLPEPPQSPVGCAECSLVGDPGDQDRLSVALSVQGPLLSAGTELTPQDPSELPRGQRVGSVPTMLWTPRTRTAGPSLVSWPPACFPGTPAPTFQTSRSLTLSGRLRDPMTLVGSHCQKVLFQAQPQSFCWSLFLQPSPFLSLSPSQARKAESEGRAGLETRVSAVTLSPTGNTSPARGVLCSPSLHC